MNDLCDLSRGREEDQLIFIVLAKQGLNGLSWMYLFDKRLLKAVCKQILDGVTDGGKRVLAGGEGCRDGDGEGEADIAEHQRL